MVWVVVKCELMKMSARQTVLLVTRNAGGWPTANGHGRCLLSTSAACWKNIRAGQPKSTPNKNKPLTYEQSQYPYLLGVSKSWNSWNISNLRDERAKGPQTTLEDGFIRRFMDGTWHNLFLSDVIIKRRQNIIVVAGYVKAIPRTRTLYFLKGYSEELLSHYLKRPVKVEIQTAGPRDLIYKYV